MVEDRWFATVQDGGFQCRVRKDGLEASTAERLKWTESRNSPYIYSFSHQQHGQSDYNGGQFCL